MAAKSGLTLLRKVVEQSTKQCVSFESVLSKLKEKYFFLGHTLANKEYSDQTAPIWSCLIKVTPISSGNGHCRCELRVEAGHQNRNGTLHGGMTCLLVDTVSTWALMTSEPPVTGVSVDLSVSFMKSVKVGQDIVIDAATLKRGGRLAFLTVDITNKEDGQLIAQGKHTKFIGEGKGQHAKL